MSGSQGLIVRWMVVGTVLLVAILTRATVPTGASPGLVTQDLSGGLTASDLAQALVGKGITISNVTYSGAAVAAGSFSGGTGIIGFESGIVLSSGSIANVVGPNVSDSTSTDTGWAGDPALSLLSGFPTFDAAVLEFDFVPSTNSVLFRYVFASDEYNEFVHTQYNDVFAFFVNGVNCATVPGTGQPVSINTINNGNPYGLYPMENPGLFINNDLSDGGDSIDTEMDGLTVILSCVAAVTPGATNHIRLAIADASDHIYDANVFLETGSFKPSPPKPPQVNRDIVFVHGIDSVGNCNGADTWVEDYLKSSKGKSFFGKLQIGKYMHFNYRGGGSYACPASEPAYTQVDTCDGVASAAGELKNLIDAQATGKVTIVGHSMGGLVAAYLVADESDWAKLNIASVVTFDSPLRGIPNVLQWAQLFVTNCSAGSQSLTDLGEGSDVVQRSATAASIVPFYPLDATQIDLPAPIEYVTRDGVSLEKARPFNLLSSCQQPGADPGSCEPPRPVDDDHGSIWGRRFDEHSENDKAFLVGCAAAVMADCTFMSAPVSQGQMTQMQMAVGAPATKVQFISNFGSVVRMTLVSPDGTAYGPDGAGPVLAYGVDDVSETYVIENPSPGDWTIQLFGVDVAPGGEDVLLAVLVEEWSQQPPVLTVPGQQNVQYSDPLTFGVSATDPDDLPESLRFSATGLCEGLALTDNLNGTATIEGAVQSPAGTCGAQITVTDPDGLTDTDAVSIVVGKEDATLAYSGDALVKRGSPVMLKASVSELPDGSPGDISQAAVFFDVTAGIGGGTTSYGPAAVSVSGEATWTLPAGLPANVYSISVRMDPGNTYYQAAPAHTAELVIYDPSAFTIGGGWVKHADENGIFAFDARYSLRGDVRGFALYLFGLSRGGRPTLLMSNSTQWLVASGNTAVFRGKATVGGVGNHTFEITVVDNGEPGKSDTFAIKIWRPDGTLLHEMPPTVLGGGNIIIRQLKGR